MPLAPTQQDFHLLCDQTKYLRPPRYQTQLQECRFSSPDLFPLASGSLQGGAETVFPQVGQDQSSFPSPTVQFRSALHQKFLQKIKALSDSLVVVPAWYLCWPRNPGCGPSCRHNSGLTSPRQHDGYVRVLVLLPAVSLSLKVTLLRDVPFFLKNLF